jgi:N-acetyltransferase
MSSDTWAEALATESAPEFASRPAATARPAAAAAAVPARNATSQWQSLFSGGSARTGSSFSRKRKATAAVTPATRPTAPKSEQLYLDFGQRSFGATKECAECGLLYTQGVPDDEEAHRRHHRRVALGVRVRGSAAERVVAERPDGARIVCIRATDGAEPLRKLGEAKVLVDAALGSIPISRLGGGDGADEAGSSADAEGGLPADFRAFLYLEPSTSRLLGCAISHPLESAFRAEPPPQRAVAAADDPAAAAAAAEPSAGQPEGVMRHDGVPRPAMAGVSHIWTDSRHRRAGVARALLDATRRHFAVGLEVPIEQLAFSQPTGHGRRLAAAYAGTENFLVYD